MSRPILRRVAAILQALQAANGCLPREDQPINCATLASELEASPRTIMRDLDFLRDDLGLPLEYEPTRHTFYLRERVATGALFLVAAGQEGGGA